ncbi:Superoxide dismutase (Cu-Zn) 4A [Citrus sinensis]|nr:Superoxide dismutase (Cu-Zn) 4A [Citrus sinensis]
MDSGKPLATSEHVGREFGGGRKREKKRNERKEREELWEGYFRYLGGFLANVDRKKFRGLVVKMANFLRPHSKAIAVLDGSEGFKGTVSFYQEDGHHTVITVNLANLKAGSHGFHVHESGFIRATTVVWPSSWHTYLIRKHFNPFNKSHSDIHDHEEHRHYGDLGNINVDYGDLGNINVGPDGKASYYFRDKMISLTGPNSIIGRTVVKHDNHDDGGKVNDDEKLRSDSSDLGESNGAGGDLPRAAMAADRAPKAASFPSGRSSTIRPFQVTRLVGK